MKQFKLFILFAISLVLGCSDPNEEVFGNYKIHKKEIYQLRDYFSNIMPADLSLYIRFHSDSKVDFKLIQLRYDDRMSWNSSRLFDQYGQYSEFDVALDGSELVAALDLVKLTPEKLTKLRAYLDKANCESIGNYAEIPGYPNSSYISIGFPTADLYGLEYNIFNSSRSDKEIGEITEACNFKKINNAVLVRWRGAAFGSECFPDKR